MTSHVFLMAILIVAYMAPGIVALARETHNSWAITIGNILLGWTVIGWFVLFFMAIGSRRKD